MTDIQWGPEIKVDGKRPEWLRDQDAKAMQFDFGYGMRRPVSSLDPIERWIWSYIDAIRLPATHFAYRALDAGFTPWGGGNEAPADWDGGEVLRREGARDIPMPDAFGPYIWGIGTSYSAEDHPMDIIGYHPKPATTETPPDTVMLARMTEEEAREWAMQRTNCDLHLVVIAALRDLGLIKPTPTPVDRFMEANPDADRRTAELVLAWKENDE